MSLKKLTYTLSLGIIAALTLVGCGGSGSSTPTPVSMNRFMFISFGSSNMIYSFRRSSAGMLTIASQAATPASAGKMDASPDGKFLYAVLGGNQVRVYDIHETGSLIFNFTFIPGSSGHRDIATNPAKNALYLIDGDDAVIRQFTRNANGTLTAMAQATLPCGLDPYGLAVSADGNSVYVADRGMNVVHAFSADAQGGLSGQGSTPTVSDPVSLELSSDGRNLYVGSASASVGQMSVSPGGLLANLTPSSFATTGFAAYLASARTGVGFYSSMAGTTNLQLSQRAANGALSFQAAPVVDLGAQDYLPFAPRDADFLYVISQLTGHLRLFGTNPNGILTPIADGPMLAGASDAVFASIPTPLL